MYPVRLPLVTLCEMMHGYAEAAGVLTILSHLNLGTIQLQEPGMSVSWRPRVDTQVQFNG